MSKKGYTQAQSEFKADYYLGIGTGILATAVSQAFNNQWQILMILGFVFIIIGIVAKNRKKK